MNNLNSRVRYYSDFSSKLACIDSKKLKQIVLNGKAQHLGIGGSSVLIRLDNLPVFVKKIPISEMELQSNNFMSTANIFNLPLCYQYGIGSTGFGAWREIAAHIMTTNWVITGMHPNFPIMYHWRIIQDSEEKKISNFKQERIDEHVAFWENSENIRQRIKSNISALHNVYVFMEYLPYNLYQWLEKKITDKNDEAIHIIKSIELQLKESNIFMKSQGFFHMDGHFKNILTDGKILYYSDFGLAISHLFSLSLSEKEFLDINADYNQCSGYTSLLHGIITNFYGKKTTLKDYIIAFLILTLIALIGMLYIFILYKYSNLH